MPDDLRTARDHVARTNVTDLTDAALACVPVGDKFELRSITQPPPPAIIARRLKIGTMECVDCGTPVSANRGLCRKCLDIRALRIEAALEGKTVEEYVGGTHDGDMKGG